MYLLATGSKRRQRPWTYLACTRTVVSLLVKKLSPYLLIVMAVQPYIALFFFKWYKHGSDDNCCSTAVVFLVFGSVQVAFGSFWKGAMTDTSAAVLPTRGKGQLVDMWAYVSYNDIWTRTYRPSPVTVHGRTFEQFWYISGGAGTYSYYWYHGIILVANYLLRRVDRSGTINTHKKRASLWTNNNTMVNVICRASKCNYMLVQEHISTLWSWYY